MREVILRNLAECKKCHDVIESTHVHDLWSCTCGAISVDGGKEYLRRSYHSALDIIERSQVEYHPIAVWLAKRVWARIGHVFSGKIEIALLKIVENTISKVIGDALKSESMHHIMGALNDLPEFASLSFEVRDKVRKTIQRELTGEYK